MAVHHETVSSICHDAQYCSPPLTAANRNDRSTYINAGGLSHIYPSFVCYIPPIQVLFYSTEIFAAAGVQYSEVATVVVGITLFGFTVVTVR